MQIFASLVNAAFKSGKKIEMLIFVTTLKNTGSHLEALTAKTSKICSSFKTT